jgi:hypothetical protein
MMSIVALPAYRDQVVRIIDKIRVLLDALDVMHCIVIRLLAEGCCTILLETPLA